jgi:hypothetical protein
VPGTLELTPPAAAHPGRLAHYVVANRGPEPVLITEIVRLDRRTDAGWVRCRLPYPARAIGYELPAGGSRQLPLPVPPDAAAGRYRITKETPLGPVSAEFDVSPGGPVAQF